MRIIHNTTFLIDPTIHVEWYNHMVETVFPDYQASVLIHSYKLSKIVSLHNSDGLNFALQLEFDSVGEWQQFMATIEPVLLNGLRNKFQTLALTFSTTMEVLEQG